MDGVPVAFVRDWLTVYAGADRVMEAALELFEAAPVYALIYQPEHFVGSPLSRHPVHTSFIQHLPGGRRAYKAYLPLMPLAVEQFDLTAYDIVISMSHTVAKGVLTRSDQLHVCYVYTPVRYAWDLYFQYLQESGLTRGVRGAVARLVLHYLRMWDQATANRPDVLVADSRYVARRIWKLYRREAQVIYPPVDLERFSPKRARESYYLTVSRLVPYKRVDLLVEAFGRMGLPLVVIGDGPERRKIERVAGPHVTLMGEQPDAVVTDYMERCRAFVFAADEDFGIAPVEAQAAGAAVIAYGRGGVTETIVPGETGLFYQQQTVESLIEAVRRFESGAHRFHPELMRRAAERFGKERFKREFGAMIEREWDQFREQAYGQVMPARRRAAVR